MNADLKKYIRGTYEFEENDDGYLSFYRYSKAQREYLKKSVESFYVRSHHSSGINIGMITEASKIEFDYKLCMTTSTDSIDTYINGTVYQYDKLQEGGREGHYICNLPDGEKDIVIYMPLHSQISINEFIANGVCKPSDRNEQVLWIGDSITQGYGPLISGMSYVNIANRSLKYDALAQGIDGEGFDAGLLSAHKYLPDKIVVSLGTNKQEDDCYNTDADDFFAALNSLYCGIPTLFITPVWRESYKPNKDLYDAHYRHIRENCGKYDNISVVDGDILVPHVSYCFLDGLHPNATGCMYYACNLIKEIRRIGF
jgi:lysophospholipase L1-like esterase